MNNTCKTKDCKNIETYKNTEVCICRKCYMTMCFAHSELDGVMCDSCYDEEINRSPSEPLNDWMFDNENNYGYDYQIDCWDN